MQGTADNKILDLDPPTSLDHSLYLGCNQYEHQVSAADLVHHKYFYEQTFLDEEYQFKTAQQTDLTEDRAQVKFAKAKKRDEQRDKKKKTSVSSSAQETAALAIVESAAAAMSNGSTPVGATVEDKRAESKVTPEQLRKVKGWHYSMHGHAERAVEKYLELTGLIESDLKFAATPNIDDHQIPINDFAVNGAIITSLLRNSAEDIILC